MCGVSLYRQPCKPCATSLRLVNMRNFKPEGCSRPDFIAYRVAQCSFAAFKRQRDRLWFSFYLNERLPEWPCCYAVYLDNELIYIGQTENLLSRFRQHRSKKEWFDYGGRILLKVKLPRKYGQWAMDEIRLLKRLRPCENKASVLSRESFLVA